MQTARSRLELLQFLETQRVEYQRTLPEKLALIDTLWRDARQAGGAAAALSALERLAHNLHGTAGTYGFRDLGQASHVLELAVRALMDAGAQLNPQEQQRITQAIVAVRLSLPPAPPSGNGAP